MEKPLIILARHAKAKHNIYSDKAVFAGGQVDSGLSKMGIVEAQELGGKIAKKFRVDAIVHSTMKRSRKTAEILAKQINAITGKKVKLIEIDGFGEIDAGDFTNRTREEILGKYPKELNSFLEGDIKNWSFPKGENYKDAKKRALKAVEKLKEIASKHGNIVAVGHGMFNRVLLSYIYPEKKELWQPTAYPHDRLVKLEI